MSTPAMAARANALCQRFEASCSWRLRRKPSSFAVSLKRRVRRLTPMALPVQVREFRQQRIMPARTGAPHPPGAGAAKLQGPCPGP
eukprot:11228297-Lingulodinium_polyedra.AAC.2